MIAEIVFNSIIFGYFLPFILLLIIYTIISYIDSDMVSFGDILFSIIPIANLIFIILAILYLIAIIIASIIGKLFKL